jgi:hypothetical protein
VTENTSRFQIVAVQYWMAEEMRAQPVDRATVTRETAIRSRRPSSTSDAFSRTVLADASGWCVASTNPKRERGLFERSESPDGPRS